MSDSNEQGKERDSSVISPMAASVCTRANSLKEQAISVASQVLDAQRELDLATKELAEKVAAKRDSETTLAQLDAELRRSTIDSESADQWVANSFERVFDDEMNQRMAVLCTSFATLAEALTKPLPLQEIETEFNANVSRIASIGAGKPLADHFEELIQWLNDVRDVLGAKTYAAKEYADFLQKREQVAKQKKIVCEEQAKVDQCLRDCALLSTRLREKKEESAAASKRLMDTARAGLEEYARKKAALEAMLKEGVDNNVQETQEKEMAQEKEMDCQKCGQRRCGVYDVQTRSSDQLVLRSYVCYSCGFKWSGCRTL